MWCYGLGTQPVLPSLLGEIYLCFQAVRLVSAPADVSQTLNRQVERQLEKEIMMREQEQRVDLSVNIEKQHQGECKPEYENS